MPSEAQGVLVRFILIILIAIPIAEIWLLLRVGSLLGVIPTIGLVILTAMLGVALLRQQSWVALSKAQEKMRSGQVPAKEIVDGLFLAVGGALLLTPGFITDTLGFVCLLPFARQGLIAWCVGPLLKRMMANGSMHVYQAGTTSQQQTSTARDTLYEKDAIEGEYRRDD